MDVGAMRQKRKIVIITIVAVLIVTIVTIAIIAIINSNNKNSTTKSKTPVSTKSVTTLRSEAEAARVAGETAKRKLLLEQAAEKLKQEPKSDANTNAQIDVAAQQCLAGVKSACQGY